jgi:hypothetical protein
MLLLPATAQQVIHAVTTEAKIAVVKGLMHAIALNRSKPSLNNETEFECPAQPQVFLIVQWQSGHTKISPWPTSPEPHLADLT